MHLWAIASGIAAHHMEAEAGGAGTRNRTAAYCLEGSHSTVKPCPHVPS